MNRSFVTSILALSLLAASQASAQQGGATVIQAPPGQSSPAATTSTGQPVSGQGYSLSSQGYALRQLEDLDDGIRRTRNALIATSAAAAVGIIVGASAASQCNSYPNYTNNYDELVCTDRGYALLYAGGMIFGFSAIGMITSGIMLGVKKGKRRRLRERIQYQAQPYGKRLQWNVESARLEF